MSHPGTQYVEVGDADVAYQVLGSGPDLLFCYGLGSHVEFNWQVPLVASFLERLASVFRLIIFDRRGTGASDGVPRASVPTLEEWTEDIAAVLDATDSEQAAILATLDTGPIAMLYAALHPERVRALVLMNTFARYVEAEDYPIGVPEAVVDVLVETMATAWGTTELLAGANPSADPEFLERTAPVTRASATPRTAAAQWRYMLRHDVRHVLPLIAAPTLVLHVAEQPLAPLLHGRYIADHIDGARLVVLPGGDLSWTTANQVVADEVAEFLTGERPEVEIDRVLATVLFTDIVGSTDRAVEVGDRRWRELLDAHDALVRTRIGEFRGREVKTTGDGVLATFDGPARAIRSAAAMVRDVRGLGLEIKVGLHTGEVEVRGDDIGGIAVHTAARVMAAAAPGEVVISRTVRDLVAGSGIEFEDRGTHELKGVPGEWALYSVRGQ
jgi:class 3 adenylate cyclase